MPTCSFSADWAMRASAVRDNSAPASVAIASPVATSSEAEDDRPAPCGRSPVTARSAPVRAMPASSITRTIAHT
ncbi:hypothetical protein BH09PSE2_BH09PSE2_19530 [soil metagenome]